MHKQVRLNDKNKKLYSSNMNMENLIYTINMNREDLSKMTKEQLIEMLLSQEPQAVLSASYKPVPKLRKFGVKQLIRFCENNNLYKPSRPIPAPRIKRQQPVPAIRNEKQSVEHTFTIRLDKKAVSLQDMGDEELNRASISKYKKDSSFLNLFHNRLNNIPNKRVKVQITIYTDIEHNWVIKPRSMRRHMVRLILKSQN